MQGERSDFLLESEMFVSGMFVGGEELNESANKKDSVRKGQEKQWNNSSFGKCYSKKCVETSHSTICTAI
jgi:hypothetical protein